MSYKSLEELLGVTDLSDDSDVDSSNASCLDSGRSGRKTVDYTEVLKTILHDKESDSISGSTGEVSPQFASRLANAEGSADDCATTRGYASSAASPNRVDVPAVFSSDTVANEVVLSSSHLLRGEQTDIHTDQLLESARRTSDATDHVNAEPAVSTPPAQPGGCRCRFTCSSLLKDLTRRCGPLFSSLNWVVRQQLDTPASIHKLLYIRRLNRRGSPGDGASSSPSDPAEVDDGGDSGMTLDTSKACLQALGIPWKELDAPEGPDLRIQHRLNVSAALTKLHLCQDGFISIDCSKVNRLSASASTFASPSCIAANHNLLVCGTEGGSLLLGDICNYRSERQFLPNEDSPRGKDDSSDEPLAWQEFDSHPGASVTYVDMLSESNWICVGYSNGTVKLLQVKKDVLHAKSSDSSKPDGGDGASVSDQGGPGRGFGLMADAVSSAFGGFKKPGSHALCYTKAFNDTVSFCKFTLGDSHDEIICASRNTVVILSYSKTVLSHNLTVNQLPAFNERILENEDVIDIACLCSNPQSKFISGASVGGLVALTTIKKCVVISTRPELSILFRVPLNDRSKKAGDNALGAFPCITWMVLNNSGDIKPLLLIALGCRLSFTLCDISVGKRSGSPVVCTNVGYIKFDSVVRNIRTISRDLFAVVDFSHRLHIVQVNVFSQAMHYDIVRTVDFGEECLLDLPWVGMVNISSTISVHTRIVKMFANSYKKFSALVSEMFQGKRNELSFDLRVFSLYVTTRKGVLSIEIHSWLKAIGDLTAKKSFPDSLALSYALSKGMVPGLLDYKAYIDNIQKLILYVLHQSSAHIIRLSKLMDSACMNLLEDDNPDGWTDQVKVDIMCQIDSLCSSMFDICICLNLYDVLSDLIFRCFATLGMEHIFVKYVLVYYFQGRFDLVQLKPDIFESIFGVYDKVLDHLCRSFSCDEDFIWDYISLLKDQVDCRHKDGCAISTPDRSLRVDEHIVVYELLCNQLSSLYVFCSRNKIPFAKEKAVCSMSKHCQWHSFVYCPELIGDDISVALDILYSEGLNKIASLRAKLKGSSPSASLDLPLRHAEDLFVVRVLYSVLNSFLTFDNCGLTAESAVTNFCNVLGSVTSTSSFKPSFPISSEVRYASRELVYEDGAIDFAHLDQLHFRTSFTSVSGPCILERLMCVSPRLLFTCLANLFLDRNSHLESSADLLGQKIDLFNFVVNVAAGCLCRLEGSESAAVVRRMLSVFVLCVCVNSESLYLDLETQAVAIYTLLTDPGDAEEASLLTAGSPCPSELITVDGSFNMWYYYNTFRREPDDLDASLRQFNISVASCNSLIKMHIRKSLFAIHRKFDCQSRWTQNSHFTSLKRFCSGLLGYVSDSDVRVFLAEVACDYENIICVRESVGSASVFQYLQKCLQCIKAGSDSSQCSVNELLLLDPSVQADFVMTIMSNVPRLIRTDMKSATDLLVEIFSLSNLASMFKDTTVQSSQDAVLSALSDSPELQLIVLNALLGLESSSVPTGAYFTQYLRLLSEHDRMSVCPFLKRQSSLDIISCLDVCMSFRIYDAVSYLLMRAGAFEDSVQWTLEAFKQVPLDVDVCGRLVSDAYHLCSTFEEFIAYETLESLWFGMLHSLLSDSERSASVQTLIDDVFNLGILKFIKLPRALLELQRYDSVEVSTFRSCLHKLLCDLEFQTFTANASSSIATVVLNSEFRRNLDCSRRGVVVDSCDSPRSESSRCVICKRNIVFTMKFDHSGERSQATSSGSKSRGSAQPSGLSSSSLSPFEQHLGVMCSLQTPSDRASPQPPGGASSGLHLANLYHDRLSTFVSKKPSGTSHRTKWNLSTLGLSPQFVPGLKKQLHSELSPWQPVKVFWCGHMFHQACAPDRCPTCDRGD